MEGIMLGRVVFLYIYKDICSKIRDRIQRVMNFDNKPKTKTREYLNYY